MEHVTIYQEAGKFCGWPANNGAWSWGNEILVCFDLHYFKEPDRSVDPTEHHTVATIWEPRLVDSLGWKRQVCNNIRDQIRLSIRQCSRYRNLLPRRSKV